MTCDAPFWFWIGVGLVTGMGGALIGAAAAIVWGQFRHKETPSELMARIKRGLQ